MVRVAGLLQQIESGVETLSIDARPPGAQLEAIRTECIGLIEEAYNTYQALLLPDLVAAGIRIVGLPLLEFQSAKATADLLLGKHLPGAYPARFRSRPPLPSHFEFEP